MNASSVTETRAPVLCSSVSNNGGVIGWVVVDSMIQGRAMGGTRMTTDISTEELTSLARAMTLKLGLAGLPIGGAKAGIIAAHSDGESKDHRLIEFGRAVTPLLGGGVYLGTDLGVTYRDRDLMHQSARYSPDRGGQALPFSWGELWSRCEDATGQGVAESTSVLLRQLKGMPRCCRSVIQGFGIVGRGVARHLTAQGHRILAVADRLGTVIHEDGLPIDRLFAATDETGTIDRDRLPRGIRTTTEPDAWLDVEADILILAAGANAIHQGNVDRLRAKVVTEGANYPCSPQAIAHMERSGVILLPGILSNAGGAIVSAVLLTGLVPELDLDQTARFCLAEVSRRIGTNTRLLFHEATSTGKTTRELASELAQARHEELKTAVHRGESPREAAARFSFHERRSSSLDTGLNLSHPR